MSRKLISFDWAMKKILRQKANFGILEGFLTELLKFEVKIEEILESEPIRRSKRISLIGSIYWQKMRVES